MNDLKKEVLGYYGEPKDVSAKMIWNFAHDLQKGDIIVANSGYKVVLGIGIIEGDYIGPENPENPIILDPSKRDSYKEYVHLRKVNWLLDDEINFNNQIFDQKTITPINEDKWNRIKAAYINKNKDYAKILNQLELPVGDGDILKIIENPDEIKDAQDLFLDILYQKADEIISTEKFDLGPKMSIDAHWSNDLGIYVVNRELDFNRYMNAFGIEKPDVNVNLPVVCEINIAKNGINRNVQGAFAKDLEGNLYLIHRGNVGGKSSKTEFFDKYPSETTQIQDGNIKTTAIVIGSLNDPKLPEAVKNFVFEVAQIKGLTNEISPKFNITDFLENVFKNYPGARAKNIPIVGSNLSQTFLDFKNDLKEFANNVPYGNTFNEYETNSAHSGRGKWALYPNVYIYDVNLRKQDKYGSYPYLVRYGFSKDIQEVYLSLRINWSYPDLVLQDTKGKSKQELRNDYFKSEVSKARAKLANLGKIPKEFSWSTPEGPGNERIYLKSYKKGHLPDEKALQEDLIEILNLYQDLIQLELQNISYNVIKELFNEYNETFLNTQMGKDHLLAYESYCKNVHNTFNTIMNDPEVINDISDPIINYLLPIKGKPIAPAAVGSIKAFGYTDEVIPRLTETVFKLVDDLNNTNDIIQQKKLIADFKNGPFSKGFQTAMLSPVLYCINNQYWLYNNKTVRTFNLLSEILGENNKIDGFLDNYIDNLDKLTNLVEDISVHIPEFSDFKVFDAFCHWMCDPKLGYYAIDREKYAEWLKINFPEEPKIDNSPRTFAEFLVDEGYYFEPEMIENFLLSFKVKAICYINW